MTILGEQKHAIDKIQFDLIRWKMADSDHCSLSIDEIDLAIEEYKRFLSLKVENPSAKLSPTKLMDEVWHFHILDTKKYRQDCMSLFGEFMDHFPSYGPFESAERTTTLLQSFERMSSLYRDRFGQCPIVERGSCSNSCGNSSCHGGGICDS